MQMGIYDEKIKKANREIEKLLADIEKKKARIAKLRTDIKQYETDKARDNEFSENLLKLMSENGITSDEDRKAVLSKVEDLMIEMEMEKSETTPDTDQPDLTKTVASTNMPTAETVINNNTDITAGYQNTSYSYKPTVNENQ